LKSDIDRHQRQHRLEHVEIEKRGSHHHSGENDIVIIIIFGLNFVPRKV
jgi:hypothetical protein